jgi:hypothetical protein
MRPSNRTEGVPMVTIVDFSMIVKEALDVFGDLLANESARQHFAENLTGLMVAERKNVSVSAGFGMMPMSAT